MSFFLSSVGKTNAGEDFLAVALKESSMLCPNGSLSSSRSGFVSTVSSYLSFFLVLFLFDMRCFLSNIKVAA